MEGLSLELARQICSAMRWLAQLRIVHGHLAARNVLVFSLSIGGCSQTTIKACGPPLPLPVPFSAMDLPFMNRLCRENSSVSITTNNLCTQVTDYWRTSPSASAMRSEVSAQLDWAGRRTRWLAPEALERQCCSEKTDVWAYGVVLWEILSAGTVPFSDLEAESDVLHAVMVTGRRLARPRQCSDWVWEVMQSCWWNEDSRPTFEALGLLLVQTRSAREDAVAPARPRTMESVVGLSSPALSVVTLSGQEKDTLLLLTRALTVSMGLCSLRASSAWSRL